MKPHKQDEVRYWSICSIIVPIRTPLLLALLVLLFLGSVASAQSLSFRIVEQEQQKKGVFYVLLIVDAVLTDAQPEITNPKVVATLRTLMRNVRDNAQRQDNPVDGITVFLYQSLDHLNGGNLALGRAEWWPKGHSFGSDNASNIKNKTTYVETVKVFSLPEQVSPVASRLSEATRREIFTALVRSEDRAMREAEAKYPLSGANIPIDELRTYDWKGVITKNSKEGKRLYKKYKQQVIQKYKISESELKAINIEAIMKNWPLPTL